jgi:hypothetical protein
MKNYLALFTQGYISGNLKDFNIDYNEFVIMCEKVRNKIEGDEKWLNFTPMARPILKNYCLKKHINEDIYEYFRNLTLQVMGKIAPDYNYIPTQAGHYGDLLVLMDDGCFSVAHHDGDVGDLTMLIYLSDPATYNGSGKLVIMENMKQSKIGAETSDPIEGNIILLETKIHNPLHKIEKITGDFKRLAYVARIKKLT